MFWFFLPNTPKFFPNIAALQGYIHSLTEVLTSLKRKTNYLRFNLQTDNSEIVQLVCYSPKKRNHSNPLWHEKPSRSQSKTQQEKTFFNCKWVHIGKRNWNRTPKQVTVWLQFKCKWPPVYCWASLASRYLHNCRFKIQNYHEKWKQVIHTSWQVTHQQ